MTAAAELQSGQSFLSTTTIKHGGWPVYTSPHPSNIWKWYRCKILWVLPVHTQTNWCIGEDKDLQREPNYSDLGCFTSWDLLLQPECVFGNSDCLDQTMIKPFLSPHFLQKQCCVSLGWFAVCQRRIFIPCTPGSTSRSNENCINAAKLQEW